jgi:L-ribulose-5-phosphate 3-epimerase
MMQTTQNKIGVMQGRLLPKYRGRYQAHPVGYWEEEFYLAKKLKLDCIEFILDYDGHSANPILNLSGIKKILSLEKETGVSVLTVCADYFMEAPLHSDDRKIAKKSLEVLCLLATMCSKLNVSTIVLPCVDQSAIKSSDEMQRLIETIRGVIGHFKDIGISLSLETDLPPKKFKELLNKINSNSVSVNYDIGNSASLGFNPVEEFNAYGRKISDVHIKDRVLGGGSVILGTGDANFAICLRKLKEIGYSGPYIMQAYRDDMGLAVFKKQLEWFQEKRK